MKKILLFLFVFCIFGGIVLFLSLPRQKNSVLPTGQWKATFLDPQNLVLTGNYRSFLESLPPQQYRRVTAGIVSCLTGPSFAVLQDNIGRELKLSEKNGYWLSGLGLLKNSGAGAFRRPDIAHYLFLTLEKSLIPGQSVKIHLKDGADLTETYRPDIPSPVFKINQVGYAASARQKYAYIGAWRGTAGALPIRNHTGGKFFLRRAEDGSRVFTGKVTRRMPDPKYRKNIPFTGEETGELDFSAYSIPGKYYLEIPSLGRSDNFIIGAEAIQIPFYIHGRGLYHKRCGLTRQPPCTAWKMNACHPFVIRGIFPSETSAYQAEDKTWGFYDNGGKQIKVNRFDLIRENPPPRPEKIQVCGGWHDAADYDRKPEHLRIVRALSILYLMKPQNFHDGQWNIPESGNGIPDILDEAVWGLRHLLGCQQADGGTGTWTETDGHPVPGDPMPDRDAHIYYLSAPSRASSMDYASAASILALALRKAGRRQESDLWQESARKAWKFALNPGNRFYRSYRYRGKRITYKEKQEPPAEFLLQAGFNLHILTGEQQFLQTVIANRETLLKEWQRDGWRWSPLAWMNLFLWKNSAHELDFLREKHLNHTQQQADKILARMDFSYPYRPLWREPDNPGVTGMAWGHCHPFRQGLYLLAAHFLTPAASYLDALYLANDFHNGANPLGRTMTSGLGRVYPVSFLDLVSYADGISEAVPGITPYGFTFGTAPAAIREIYSFFPGPAGKWSAIVSNLDTLWPIWRRLVSLEILSIPSSEYTIWETIAPAVIATGYLLDQPDRTGDPVILQQPARNYRQLPGYAPLP